MTITAITVTQAARAMGLETGELDGLLIRCGIQTEDGLLDQMQIQMLLQFLEDQQKQSRERAQENLEKLAERYTLLIDTCSLLHPQFPELMTHLLPLLRENGKALIIPSGVVAELQSLGERKVELRDQIRALVKQLAALKREGLVSVYGESTETFGDKQLLATATRFLTSTELLVITQDNALSNDLLHLNRLGSVRGKRLTVGRINRYGYLSRFLTQEKRFAASDSRSPWTSVSQTAAPVAENRTPLPVGHVPDEGEPVRCGSGTLRLGSKLASGGEGTIYDLGDGTVAKLYHANKLTVGRRDKLEKMVATDLDCPGVCWPQELLYDLDGCFVGYRMQKARGLELQRCLFTRPALEKHFPAWKKIDTVRLCVTILEKICALHSRGIILGDINPLNILVVSPEEVWFVDCDSYQIGGYPCPVGTVRFTAPEIQKKDFSTFLRTPGNEAFAVATLLFMLMLPGKSPYAQQGGGDLGEAIQAMEFPYPCGDNRSENLPEGAWRFLWSHLPRYIKNYFYGTFQRGGQYSEENTRLSAEKWLSAFQGYHDLLTSGKLQEQDPQSGEIFPTRWKVVDPAARTVWETRTCVECGETFDIMDSERTHYLQMGMQLPRRCPTCRKLRKLARSSESFSVEL